MGCAQEGTTPLHRAAQAGHASVVTVLLEFGADKDAKDEVRRAAPAPAARRRKLCRGAARCADATSPPRRGRFVGRLQIGTTALHRAAQNGHANVARVLLEHKANKDAKVYVRAPRSARYGAHSAPPVALTHPRRRVAHCGPRAD